MIIFDYGHKILERFFDGLKGTRAVLCEASKVYQKLGYTIAGLYHDAKGFGKSDIYMAKWGLK
jgi:hypothetical protein